MTVTNGDVLKAVLSMTLQDGTIAQNVFYWIAELTADQSNSTVLDNLETWIEGAYGYLVSWLDDEMSFDTLNLQTLVWNATESYWETYADLGTAYPTITPSGTAQALPNQVAATLTAYTDWPKTRGRKFIAGLTEDCTDGSELMTATASALSSWLAAYLADRTLSTGNVLRAGVPVAAQNIFRQFTTGLLNAVVGSQRRRKPGEGA